jgi:hypothetical protein
MSGTGPHSVSSSSMAGSLLSPPAWVASPPDYACGANRGSGMAEAAVPVNALPTGPGRLDTLRRKSVRSSQYRAANLS